MSEEQYLTEEDFIYKEKKATSDWWIWMCYQHQACLFNYGFFILLLFLLFKRNLNAFSI